MAYHLKENEPVPQALRRLGRERVERAIACLNSDDPADPARVHCARKEIKKARAVVRLARPAQPKKQARAITRELREAAQALSAPRDAYIKTQTLRELKRRYNGLLTPQALRTLQTQLNKDSTEEMRRFADAQTARAVKSKLKTIVTLWPRLHLKGKGWRMLGPGLQATYRQGRHAYQKATKDPTAENFHEWRKRVKALGYQLKLFRRSSPEPINEMVSTLAELGEYLGEDHDLAVLREHTPADAGERDVFHALIDHRQRQLRSAALTSGKQLYAEKPAVFHDRIAGYWHTHHA